MKPRGRPVYSTEKGRLCPRCGWPAASCRCAASQRPAEAAIPDTPARIVARLSLERAHRGGKTVTVVDGLPRNQPFLEELARELKRAFGAGGAVVDGRVEIQGDRREGLRAALAAKGWTVKG